MKTQFMFLLFAMLTWQCSQPTASAQVPNSNISKKIKTIENYQIHPESGDKKHISSKYFDRDGKLTKSFNYNSYPSGGTDEKKCTYDAQGNMKCITTDESGKETYMYAEKFEGENKVEVKTTYGTSKFKYDKNDNLILKEEYDSDEIFSKAEKYELNYIAGTSNLASEITFKKRGNGDFEKHAKSSYTYNENGKLKKEISTSNFYQYVYEYQYFLNGKLKEKTTFNRETEKVVTKYNEDGQRKIEAIFRSEGPTFPMEIDQKNKWTYDEHGNEIASESFRMDKLISKNIREITYY